MMGKLTLTTFLSLDGVMQAPGGPREDSSGNFPYGGWLFHHADAGMGAFMTDVFNKADALLLGRTTYDIFSAHWPKVTDPQDPIADKLNTLPKFVASRTREQFDWRNSTHVRDVAHEITDIQQRFTGEVQVHGSCDLAQTLMRHDLIDEYRLLTFPVTLGTGKRLFGSGTRPATLKLAGSKVTEKGTVINIYRRGGDLVTGSFALD